MFSWSRKGLSYRVLISEPMSDVLGTTQNKKTHTHIYIYTHMHTLSRQAKGLYTITHIHERLQHTKAYPLVHRFTCAYTSKGIQKENDTCAFLIQVLTHEYFHTRMYIMQGQTHMATYKHTGNLICRFLYKYAHTPTYIHAHSQTDIQSQTQGYTHIKDKHAGSHTGMHTRIQTNTHTPTCSFK